MHFKLKFDVVQLYLHLAEPCPGDFVDKEEEFLPGSRHYWGGVILQLCIYYN
jgi:hypothetical protein